MERVQNHLHQTSGRTRDPVTNRPLAPHTNLSYEINQVSAPLLVLNLVTISCDLTICKYCVISTGQTHKKVCISCARRLGQRIKNRDDDLSEDGEDFWIEEIQKRKLQYTSCRTDTKST